MNKPVVTILAATLVVAVLLVYMPVERASTVHSGIQNALGSRVQDSAIDLLVGMAGVERHVSGVDGKVFRGMICFSAATFNVDLQVNDGDGFVTLSTAVAGAAGKLCVEIAAKDLAGSSAGQGTIRLVGAGDSATVDFQMVLDVVNQ